jgi:ABC-type sugar transport system ATPase subunit
MQRYVGQPLFVGLRPESFALVDDVHTSVHLRLNTIETLGHEQLLYFALDELADNDLVVRLAGSSSYTPGDEVVLRINTRELYFFNADGIAIYDP